MLVFGIDTCCMAATAALMSETVMLAQTVISHKKTHSQMMMPQIESMFSLSEISPSDVDVFAVAVGPGSFTGVRIGVATAKAMAQAQNKPCVAVSTLEALAHTSSSFRGILCPILDARRNQVYNALFDCDGKTMTRKCNDRALTLSELLDELGALDNNIIFMGDGTLAYREEIEKALGSRACFAPIANNLNLAGSVAELGMKMFRDGIFTSYKDLIPQYVRLSQAERDKLEQNS